MNEQKTIETRDSSQWKISWLLLMGLSLVVFLLALITPINYGGSDSHFSLIVSQSLLENKTFYVEDYKDLIPEQFETYGGLQLRNWQGHIYYRYPLGTSLFAVPFVWAANQFINLNMLNSFENHLTQNFIAALTVVGAFLLIYGLGRCYLDRPSSIIIALVFTLGSSVMSTMGTALWNMNFLVIFELTVLWLIARYETGKTQRTYSFVLGLLLFAAFFTRPTVAIFIGTILIYLFWKHRAIFWTTALMAGVCLFGFTLFSWTTYGELLPPYYAAGSWIDPDNIFVALFGVLASPSRGLFIYSSFLFVVLVGNICYFPKLKREGLFWVCVSWFCLLTVIVSSTRNWWGGYSFGARLLTDVLPALILLTILLWQIMRETASQNVQYGTAAVFIILGVFSVYIHSYQGLFNLQPVRWNGALPPMVDRHPEYIFNWRYPQFLASSAMICERNLDYIQAIANQDTPLVVYEWGTVIGYDGDQYFNIHGDTPAQRRQKELLLAQGELPVESEPVPNYVLFAGWGPPHENKRNTACEKATLFLKLGDFSPNKDYQMSILAEAKVGTIMDVFINEHLVDTVIFNDAEEGETAVLTIPGSLWQANSLNEIQLYFPGPEIREGQQGHQIRLREMKIEDIE